MKKYFGILKQTAQEFGQDKAPRLGAALAYYTIFSMAPLLLIAIAVAGMVLGDEAASGGIQREVSKVMGPQTGEAINDMIANAKEPKSGTIATILGVVTLLFGASGVFGQLKDALNTIWNVEAKKRPGVMGFIRDRFLSMAMVMGVAFLLLVTLVVDAAISGMNNYINRMFPGGSVVLHAVQLVVSFALITVLFAAIFRVLPDLKVAWRDVWLGAAFTSLLFVLGKFGLGLYLGKAAPGSSFGAAGSLVILLIWVYWSAQILFFGAEFTQVYARTLGSMKGDTSKAQARQQGGRVEDRPKAQTDGRGKPRMPGAPVPAYARSATANRARKSGGGMGKLIGGVAIGTILGGLAGMAVAVKSVKKVLSLPTKWL